MVEPYVKVVTEGLTGVFSVNGDVHDELDPDVGRLACVLNFALVSVHVWTAFHRRHHGRLLHRQAVTGVSIAQAGVSSVNADVHDELDPGGGHLVCLQSLDMVSVHVWIVFLHRHRGYSGNIFRSLMWWLWHVRRRHGTQSQ